MLRGQYRYLMMADDRSFESTGDVMPAVNKPIEPQPENDKPKDKSDDAPDKD
jgi:hypothetical protein